MQATNGCESVICHGHLMRMCDGDSQQLSFVSVGVGVRMKMLALGLLCQRCPLWL